MLSNYWLSVVTASHRCFHIWWICHFVGAIHLSHHNNHKCHHLLGYLELKYHVHDPSNAYFRWKVIQFMLFGRLSASSVYNHKPLLVSAIECAICTGIRLWFIATILFTITVIIVQSFDWYCFTWLNAKEYAPHQRIVQIIILKTYPSVD